MDNGSVQVQGSLQDLIKAKVNLTDFIVQGQDDEELSEEMAALVPSAAPDNDDDAVLEDVPIGDDDDDAPAPSELATRNSKEEKSPKMLKRTSSGFKVTDTGKGTKSSKAGKGESEREPGVERKKGQLTQDEERGVGDIGYKTMRQYFVGVSCAFVVGIFGCVIASQVNKDLSTFWIAAVESLLVTHPVTLYSHHTVTCM